MTNRLRHTKKCISSYLPSSLFLCVHSSAFLLDKSGSWSWTAWRTIQKVNASRLGKCTFPPSPFSPWKEDNNTCWHGLISLKCWKAQATSTIAPLVFNLFSAWTSVLCWPPTLSLPLHFCPVRTRLSPDAWVMVYWPSTWGDKHLQRNSSCLEW